jgi:hypothetical protein
VVSVCLTGIDSALGQLIDRTQAPNATNEGIAKSLDEQLGVGRGDIFTANSSAFVIARDPFRAIRRGRQLFQRKFTRMQGQGPSVGDGHGDIQTRDGIGAGLADSCATCHGRPRGSAGFGGNVVTRPDTGDPRAGAGQRAAAGGRRQGQAPQQGHRLRAARRPAGWIGRH